tara:strand:+ start:512 stop:1060 length:549 start_codon:yes stop_codon:yes gene_type:complete
MKNKKAEITTEEMVKIILAVMGIFLLLYLSVNLHGLFTTKTKIEQARVSLDKLYLEIEKIENNEKVTSEVFLESPNDWWVIAWPYQEENEKPSQCKKESCICICPKARKSESIKECGKKGICKDVSKEIETIYKLPSKGFEEEIFNSWIALLTDDRMPILIKGPTSLKIELENEKIVVKNIE